MRIDEKVHKLEIDRLSFLCNKILDFDNFKSDDETVGWWKSKCNIKLNYGSIEYGILKKMDCDYIDRNLFIGRKVFEISNSSFSRNVIIMPFAIPSDNVNWSDRITKTIIKELGLTISELKKKLSGCNYRQRDTFTSILNDGSLLRYTHYSNAVDDFNRITLDLNSMLFESKESCPSNCKACKQNTIFPKQYNLTKNHGVVTGKYLSVCFYNNSGQVIEEFDGDNVPKFIETPEWCPCKIS